MLLVHEALSNPIYTVFEPTWEFEHTQRQWDSQLLGEVLDALVPVLNITKFFTLSSSDPQPMWEPSLSLLGLFRRALFVLGQGLM